MVLLGYRDKLRFPSVSALNANRAYFIVAADQGAIAGRACGSGGALSAAENL